MPPLSDELRGKLEKAVIAARDAAEAGALAALQRLFVDNADSKALPAAMSEAQRALRVQLRAHARQLGDQVPGEGPQRIERLTAECAYEFWHRMLFARYLAENDLLIHPEYRQPIPLRELEEFAQEAGVKDKWEYAASCATRMLPEIFRPGDPLLQVPFAPEDKLALEKILVGLQEEMFTADDSLGWVYQFWQTKRKEQVNDSEVKIGGDELPAVTQLFTEPYMVQFLLHNTLGAWWWARHNLAGSAPTPLPGYEFVYLRFRDDGTPAAGAFPGWPQKAAELKVLDPCCGSGHFLVEAFAILVCIRMHDEGLTAREACDAVLRDNLFGLELDARCTQIAAFNLALAAWKFPDAGGYRILPRMNIACSGQAPKGKREDWLRLAAGDRRLQWGLGELYDLFKQANDLGSLIDPRGLRMAPGIGGTFEELRPLLHKALQREDVRRDAEMHATGVAAEGITRTAELLISRYTLVVTNVPFLGRGKQVDDVKVYLMAHYFEGKADLATAFVVRSLELCQDGGSTALVTPQNWLFLTTYKKLRKALLEGTIWNAVAKLGTNAFRDMNWWAATTALIVISQGKPDEAWELSGIDVSANKDQDVKAARLSNREPTPIQVVRQADQLRNPDAAINLITHVQTSYLRDYATCYQGLTTADDGRWRRQFWEFPLLGTRWWRLHAPSQGRGLFTGREDVVDARLITTSDHTGVIRGREA